MCGIGTILVEVIHAGRDAVGGEHVLPEVRTVATRLVTLNGVFVVTARPWKAAGLHLADRCVAVMVAERPDRSLTPKSFHQLWHVRRARDCGDDRIMIAHEDVLVLRLGLNPGDETNGEGGD